MKIIIATGASGGHIFPALSLAEELKKDWEIIFICDKGKAEEGIKKAGYRVIAVTARKLRSWLDIFSFISGQVSLLRQSLKIIKDFQPDVVAGFGSYVSFAAVMAARIKGVPAIIHEQNVMPGRANRLLAGLVNRIAVSFAESQNYFPKDKTFITGCPVRRELLSVDKAEALQRFNLSADKFTILVLGGSQGSHILNTKVSGAITGMERRDDLQVIHLAGSADQEWVESEYRKAGITHCVFAFLEGMGYAYKIADLVVSRSGASAVAEISVFGLPAILVPYPFAYGHQLYNAKVLVDAGGAILIQDADLSENLLQENIQRLMNDRRKLQEMAQKSRTRAMPDAAGDLAKAVRGMIG
jgi:UDP-N-acetylglucosamine--N-acetylmuramyl-(pentapeptide) pyrophosphoryl-undecaprenol N-acetylglucosamine transferase